MSACDNVWTDPQSQTLLVEALVDIGLLSATVSRNEENLQNEENCEEFDNSTDQPPPTWLDSLVAVIDSSMDGYTDSSIYIPKEISEKFQKWCAYIWEAGYQEPKNAGSMGLNKDFG